MRTGRNWSAERAPLLWNELMVKGFLATGRPIGKKE
jgi:hypothetical protein